MNDNDKYKDIYNLEHHTSSRHNKMSILGRAAQFAPFSALTGFENAAKEEARITEDIRFIDENKLSELNEKLFILNNINKKVSVVIIYFKADERKSGGKYIKTNCIIKKIDQYSKSIITEDKEIIPIDSITEIEADIFKDMEI